MSKTQWPYPGSRWWKFDFHTHTPASADFAGSENDITPEEWLKAFMVAEIDCVAVTDHNSGAWIDKLKDAYIGLQKEAAQGVDNGFRELTIFPGVEISANSGVHVLAIFGPDTQTNDIWSLLGLVEYRGTYGDSDAETSRSVEHVVDAILSHGGIPIPAHADKAKGLLQVGDDSKCLNSAAAIRQVFEKDVRAVEWCDSQSHWPGCVESHAESIARVLGSDSHRVGEDGPIGRKFTWVKMAKPSLDGLRLALLDGNGVSLRRSDETGFEPYRVPSKFIRKLTVHEARFMGNGTPLVMEFSPFFNAVVGGRGTGKSSVVHATRLATARGEELKTLGESSEPYQQFSSFHTLGKRNEVGGLRESTRLELEWQHNDTHLKIEWTSAGTILWESYGGGWSKSTNQAISHARFPIRIFSQGQIAAMASGGRAALMALIDESGEITESIERLAQAERTFLRQRAQLREIDGVLKAKPEAMRKLTEINAKLKTLADAGQTEIMNTFALTQHQKREVRELSQQVRQGIQKLKDVRSELVFDDWTPSHFAAPKSDILAWRSDFEEQFSKTLEPIEVQIAKLQALVDSVQKDPRFVSWLEGVHRAEKAHEDLQSKLATQGVQDPNAFARLTKEAQSLGVKIRDLEKRESEKNELTETCNKQLQTMFSIRESITQRRAEFIAKALAGNSHVRIEVVPFGFESSLFERELRGLLDVNDGRFAEDFEGMVAQLSDASADEKAKSIQQLKEDLLKPTGTVRWQNHLQTKLANPEFTDRIMCWFPPDDLSIEYRRGKEWASITQGSQGQKSAALLAFLLAFGDEPIVLDQPEDDLDNHLIYELIVKQIRENKVRRQLIVVTHNPNVVVNGDAEHVHVMNFVNGQCIVEESGTLLESDLRREVCVVMEGGHEAFSNRWKRLGPEL